MDFQKKVLIVGTGKSGINAGTVSVLVMSGETDEQILKESKDKPDIVLSDAGEIIKGEIIR